MKNHRPYSTTVIFMGCVIICVLLATGLTNAASSEPQYGGILRIAEWGEGARIGWPPTMYPVVSNRQAAPAVETLLRIDKTGKPGPWLATGVKTDIDSKTIILTLRRGVKFHDGTDFNADAVKWNLEQCMTAKTRGTEKFKSIDKIDDYTIRIQLTEWDSTLTGVLTQNVGMMISPTAYKKNGEDWCTNHPVGTGPFQFVSWQINTKTIYKKFDGYWQKGKPYLDGIEWAPIVDTLTRELSFRRGESDLMLTQEAKGIANLEKDGYGVVRSRPGSGAWNLLPDSANPDSPFADVRVRQAAQYAIDTKAIVESIFYGEAEVTNQYTYKGHWAYNPSVVGYPYNPAKAKRLLAEAGYANGFKTKSMYINNPTNDRVNTAVQGFLSEVGIDVQLDPAQRGRWFQAGVQGGKWEGFIYTGPFPNPDVAGTLALRYAGGGPYKWMTLPADYMEAIHKALVAPDFETKQKWTQEALKLMIDKHCLQIVLFCPPEFAASQPNVRNHGVYETTNAIAWTPEDAWLER